MSGRNDRYGPVVAEFHPRPGGHFVFDSKTWEDIKATTDVQVGSHISGVSGNFVGTDVYVDQCPWDCTHNPRGDAQ